MIAVEDAMPSTPQPPRSQLTAQAARLALEALADLPQEGAGRALLATMDMTEILAIGQDDELITAAWLSALPRLDGARLPTSLRPAWALLRLSDAALAQAAATAPEQVLHLADARVASLAGAMLIQRLADPALIERAAEAMAVVEAAEALVAGMGTSLVWPTTTPWPPLPQVCGRVRSDLASRACQCRAAVETARGLDPHAREVLHVLRQTRMPGRGLGLQWPILGRGAPPPAPSGRCWQPVPDSPCGMLELVAAADGTGPDLTDVLECWLTARASAPPAIRDGRAGIETELPYSAGDQPPWAPPGFHWRPGSDGDCYPVWILCLDRDETT